MRAAVVTTFGGRKRSGSRTSSAQAETPARSASRSRLPPLNPVGARAPSGRRPAPARARHRDVAGTVGPLTSPRAGSPAGGGRALRPRQPPRHPRRAVVVDASAPPGHHPGRHARRDPPQRPHGRPGARPARRTGRSQSLLVTGAAGAVGGYAVAARRPPGHRGHRVRSAADELLHGLGATRRPAARPPPRPTPSSTPPCTGRRALAWVGTAAPTRASSPAPRRARRAHAGGGGVAPDGARLAELVRLADERTDHAGRGDVRPRRRGEAHARLAEGGVEAAWS